MGRRLLLIIGMMLLATTTTTVARGQNDVETGRASNADAQSNPGAGGLPGSERPPKEDLNLQTTQGAVPAPADATAATPPAGNLPVASDGSPSASPTEAESEKTASDRLPLGKQSVGVSVDVQSPASMNLNKDAPLKLIVRNTGLHDALNVQVHDELPEGLTYVSSEPKAHVAAQSLLSWRFNLLPAGTERVITVKVTPTKAGGFEHAATVTFMTGCKSRTTVFEPKLKVDVVANPTTGKVLKGQPVEFKVSVTNTGNGPARNVSIKATLSPGLKHDSKEREFELLVPDLKQNETEKLDSLLTTALIKGDQSCTVVATSPDVVFVEEEAKNVKMVSVVAPELKLALSAPESRYTDTVADYEINLQNSGTAPARKVRVVTTVPTNGRLVKVPKDADYDRATRRLIWKVDQFEPDAKLAFPFQVRMMGSGLCQCVVEATADATPKVYDEKSTDVQGMPLVELDVSERKHVLDVNGITTFQIRIRNSGTADAMNLHVEANLSPNLEVRAAGDAAKKVKSRRSTDGRKVEFLNIGNLPREKEILLGIEVKVLNADPQLATCRVTVKHDELPDNIDDMAGVKVVPPGRTASAKSKSVN